METNDDLRKERLEPRADILDGPRIHGECSRGFAAEREAHFVVEAPEKAFDGAFESESRADPFCPPASMFD